MRPVVFRSGGEVDDWLSDVIDNAGGDAEVVTLLDSVKRLDDDPHWWQDATNGVRAVEAIRAELTKADPAGRAAFARNAERAARTLRSLDRADQRHASSACRRRSGRSSRRTTRSATSRGATAWRWSAR